MKSPQVSVIIRTYNEERYIGLLLDTLSSQDFDQEQTEIVVIDSGSTDHTVEIAKRHDLQLLEMLKGDFTYSKSLDLGIENSRGIWIIILSAHAIPTDRSWLKTMVQHFSENCVAGVYCRQIPWPDAPWDEEMRLEKTFPENPRVFTADDGIQGLHFSNAASCILREAWNKQPFPEIPAAEDRAWALWAIQSGYKIVYDPSVSVFHSHSESSRSSARRLIEIAKSTDVTKKRKRTFFLTMRNSMGMCLRDIKKIMVSERCKGKRFMSIYNSLRRSVWFVWDFK